MPPATRSPTRRLVLQPGAPGEDLILTIDAGLQVAVEQELLATWIADRAKRVSAVVMDPYSGEIYAYGSYPSYDANDYQAVGATEPGRFVDPLVSTVYEPGSVFKMMTATAALGDGTVTHGDEVQGRRHAPARRRQDEDRQREPPGHGRHEVQGRDRLLAQRRRCQGRPEARAHDRRGGAQAVLDLDPPRVRVQDRPRRRPRGRRPAARPGHDQVAPDRPRQRRVRPGRRGDADAARAVVRGDGQRRRARAAAPRQAGRHPGRSSPWRAAG